MNPLEEYRQANSRQASVAALVVGLAGDPLASQFGGAPVALPDEDWPTCDDEPLLFVCQLNLTNAPLVPELLQGVALITLFVGADPGYWNRDNGDGWCLRAYPTLEGLVPLAAPEGATAPATPCAASWELVDDWPCYDDPERIEPDGLDEDEDEALENVAATKLGGWPSNIQADQWWYYQPHEAAPRYCLQVNSEPAAGLILGDSGTIYLARGTAEGCENEWFLDWQCF